MPTLTEQTVADYFAATRSMDADRFVALFDTNAEQHDPVGAPVNVGLDAIRAFITGIFSSFQTIGLTEREVYAIGTSAAVVWTGQSTAHTGKSVTFQGVDVIDCNEAGKIVLVRAFWDPAPVMATLKP